MAWVPRASEVDGTRASAAPQDGQTGHLRILHLEDDTADSELIGSLLQTAGLDCELERVDTLAAFEASLASGAFQIILSDYSLPGFDGHAALGLARSLKPELPFLFVSGTIGEELAIESLKEGATDFVLLAEQAMALARGRLDGMAVELAPELPEVRGDPARLLQVLQNLLENAGQFRGEQEQPRVEVGMRRDGAARVFYVRDNGIGIEPRHHERVFGLFHKLDPRSPGSGIGLALARRIVEAHGGRLWVESDGKRQGATFCFTLPGA